ncbi:DUF3024 domain-containing protein [Enterovibrio sp. ZSDZ35]|uniref:DUF3024 domain-containing protein n=1 Tax=Enterovibrio qingdaonensis TaxID=2899818 RepID=A0ABT5QPI3_9GAMM|nr:DUF3024 domain-containing protein [Enterovibrio sp. ZSDZ35]MDD1782893.1 DUF3024 domain-containing protein [Enterovibrio sp. ZSDZ35]
MALSELEVKRVEKAATVFLATHRPPPEVRSKLDIGWHLDRQSIVIFEIRPIWNDPRSKEEYPFAKATFVRTQGIWKIYWMRQDLKWHSYEPVSQVKTAEAVFETVSKDEYGCFFG